MQSAKIIAVDTSLGTNLILAAPSDSTISELRGLLEKEHIACFPDHGLVNAGSIMVDFNHKKYHVAESLHVGQVFRKSWSKTYAEITHSKPKETLQYSEYANFVNGKEENTVLNSITQIKNIDAEWRSSSDLNGDSVFPVEQKICLPHCEMMEKFPVSDSDEDVKNCQMENGTGLQENLKRNLEIATVKMGIKGVPCPGGFQDAVEGTRQSEIITEVMFNVEEHGNLLKFAEGVKQEPNLMDVNLERQHSHSAENIILDVNLNRTGNDEGHDKEYNLVEKSDNKQTKASREFSLSLENGIAIEESNSLDECVRLDSGVQNLQMTEDPKSFKKKKRVKKRKASQVQVGSPDYCLPAEEAQRHIDEKKKMRRKASQVQHLTLDNCMSAEEVDQQLSIPFSHSTEILAVNLKYNIEGATGNIHVEDKTLVQMNNKHQDNQNRDTRYARSKRSKASLPRQQNELIGNIEERIGGQEITGNNASDSMTVDENHGTSPQTDSKMYRRQNEKCVSDQQLPEPPDTLQNGKGLVYKQCHQTEIKDCVGEKSRMRNSKHCSDNDEHNKIENSTIVSINFPREDHSNVEDAHSPQKGCRTAAGSVSFMFRNNETRNKELSSSEYSSDKETMELNRICSNIVARAEMDVLQLKLNNAGKKSVHPKSWITALSERLSQSSKGDPSELSTQAGESKVEAVKHDYKREIYMRGSRAMKSFRCSLNTRLQEGKLDVDDHGLKAVHDDAKISCPAGCGRIYAGRTSAYYRHKQKCIGN